MTVAEMQHSFLLKVKSLDRVEIRDILSYDAVTLLNQAQDIIVDDFVANKQYGLLRPITESIQVDETAGSYTDDWDTTYETGITAVGDGASVNQRVVKLSSLGVTSDTTFRNYIRSQAKITRTNVPVVAVETFVAVELVPKEIIRDFETTGTNLPIFTNPRGILEGDYLAIIGDYYTSIEEATVVVIRTPKKLDLVTNTGAYVTTCELPVETHQMIVDRAIALYQETVNVNDLNRQ